MIASILNQLNRLVERHLRWLHRVTTRRPGAAFAAMAVLVVLSVVSIATTRFDSDIFQLFPSGKGPLKLFVDTLRWTGGGSDAIFLLEGDKERLPAEAEAFAERLKSLQIDGKPAFLKVNYRLYDESELPSFAAFVSYAVLHPQLFLPPEKTADFVRRLEPEEMRQALAATETALAQPGPGGQELVMADPLGLSAFILPRLQQGNQALDLDPTSPYFFSRDGKMMIVLAQPARPVRDMDFARKLAAGIEEARKGAKVSISAAGAHISAAMDEKVMKREIIACIVSSLVVVLALFFLTYRRILPTLLLPLIIAVGVTLALGVAGAVLPSVHIIAFAFMALIIGLGTDYSIHLYDRYHTERSTGAGMEDALEAAVTDTGHGVFTAATTTALPFLALGFAEVRALSELGLLVGLGVIFTLYATYVFLPPLLIFMERVRPGASFPPLPSFGLRRVWRGATGGWRFWSLASVVTVVAALFFAPRISFEGDLKNLQPKNSEVFRAQEKVERHLAISPKELLIAVDGKTLDEVLLKGERVDALARSYAAGGVTLYSSLGSMINTGSAQRSVARDLANGLSMKKPAEDLRRELAAAGFATEPFAPLLAGLGNLALPAGTGAADAISALERSPLRGVVQRHLARDAEGYHLLAYLHYSPATFDVTRFLKELPAAEPTVRTASIDLVSSQLAATVRTSFLWGFALGGVMVVLLLLSHFSGGRGIFAALFPVGAGLAAMLALMALCGMRINFMNAMVIVTILGMGSDYGLHVAHTVGGAKDGEGAFVQSGRAVFLSAATTVAGFGSLAFTDYGALSSIGWATNFGIIATMLFSLVSLPAFLWRKRKFVLPQ